MGSVTGDSLRPRILLAVVLAALLAGCSAREDLEISVDDPLAEPATEDCEGDWADCDFEAR